MATIVLYADIINQMPGLFKDVKKSVADYKSELFALKSKSLKIKQSICNLDDVVRIVIGLVCIVVGAVLTALTGGVFAAVLLVGLKAAAISVLISGTISMGISLISSGKHGDSLGTMWAKALNAFGDGLASGFMIGGIMAGVSMSISATFKMAAKLGISTGRNGRIGKEGFFKILSPDRIATDGNGGGTLLKIGRTFRIDFDTRILIGGRYINPLKLANFMHMHLLGLSQNVPYLLIVGGHVRSIYFRNIGRYI